MSALDPYIQIISTVGFPILMCLLFYFDMKKSIEARIDKLEKRFDDFIKECASKGLLTVEP